MKEEDKTMNIFNDKAERIMILATILCAMVFIYSLSELFIEHSLAKKYLECKKINPSGL